MKKLLLILGLVWLSFSVLAGSGSIVAINQSAYQMSFKVWYWQSSAWQSGSAGSVYASNQWVQGSSAGVYWKFEWKVYPNGAVVKTDYSSNPLGGTEDFVTTYNGNGQVTTYYYCTYHLCVTNNTDSPQGYRFFLGGSDIGFDLTQMYTNLNWNPNIGATTARMGVMPGMRFCYDYTLNMGTNNGACPVAALVPENPAVPGVEDAGTHHSDTAVGPSTGKGPMANSPIGNTGGTNTPPWMDPLKKVDWWTNSAGGGPATSGDINRATDALLRGMGNLAEIVQGKANEATLRGATNLLKEIKDVLTSMSFSNSPNNVDIAATNILVGISNRMKNLVDMAETNTVAMDKMLKHLDIVTNALLTGLAYTNYSTNMSFVSVTNTTQAGAQAGAEQALSGPMGDFDSKKALIPSSAIGPGGVVNTADTGQEFDITIHHGVGTLKGGQTVSDFRIRPEDATWAAIWDVCHSTWTWLLFAGYCLKILNEMFAVYKTMISNPGGGIPNMVMEALGSGGNIAGMALAPVITMVSLGFWGIMCGVVWTGASGSIEWSFMMNKIGGDPTNGFLTGMPRHLLLKSFPWETAVALFMAYITYRLTVMKVCVLTNAALRFVYRG